MLKHVNRAWFFLFGGIFILLLFSNMIFPITYDDDFAYSLAGNPFLLQWAEYLTWHGRMISHTPLRIILQWGFPFTDIAASLLALGGFILAYLHVNPKFLSDTKPADFYFFGALFMVLYAFVPMSCTAYGQTTFFMSNIFAVGLVLLFLLPYASLLGANPSKPKLLALIPTAFIAGAAHEQAVAVLPLILGLWAFLKFNKQPPPRWFWAGLTVFILGYLVIALSPGSYTRIETYGGARSWSFMGQTYDWIGLGWKRYFYALFRHLFLDRISAYVPNTIAYYLIIIFLYIRLVKKLGFGEARLVKAVFYVVLSWGFTAVMMFSPLYYQANLIWGLIPLWIALFILLKTYYESFQPKKPFKILFGLLCAAGLIIWGMQVFAWNHYRKEYTKAVALIEKAKAEGAVQVELTPFTQSAIATPLGNIYPVYLYRSEGFYSRMAAYHKSPPIIIKKQ